MPACAISAPPSHPDAFTTPLDDPHPSMQALAAHGRTMAFLYSVPVSGTLPVLSRRGGCLRYTFTPSPHYCVGADGTFEDYCRRFRPMTLSTLRRKIRRVARTSGRGDCCRTGGGRPRWRHAALA